MRSLKKGDIEDVADGTARLLIGYGKAVLYVEPVEVEEINQPEIEKEEKNVRIKHRK